MEAKYYTPEFHEFHEGFEYIDNLFNVNTTKRFIYKEVDGWRKSFFIKGIDNNQIKVKCLDRKDIEILGWKYDPNEDNEEQPDMFDIHGYSKGYHKINNDIQYILYHFPNNFVIIESIKNNSSGYENMHFRGYIKNKSELKKIMVQTGILNK